MKMTNFPSSCCSLLLFVIILHVFIGCRGCTFCSHGRMDNQRDDSNRTSYSREQQHYSLTVVKDHDGNSNHIIFHDNHTIESMYHNDSFMFSMNDSVPNENPSKTMLPLNSLASSEPTEHDMMQNKRNLLFFPKRCPPVGFDAMSIFNLTAYIAARWYVIRQKPVIYAGEETFCSYAEYRIDPRPPKQGCFFPFVCQYYNRRIYINVKNRGLRNSINGSENIATLSAIVPNAIQEPSKIQVSFRIPGRTNYWIVAAGSYEEVLNGTYQVKQKNTNDNTTIIISTKYDWAIISGGAPNVVTSRGKCVAGRLGRFDVRGLWMFARQPQPPLGVIEAITNLTEEQLGLDTTVWRNVTHIGCINY
jgi:hypothetical protein